MADYQLKIENIIHLIDIIDNNKIKIDDKEILYNINFNYNDECILSYENKTFEAIILNKNEKSILIDINNEIYEVEFKDKVGQIYEKFNKYKKEKKEQIIIRAPMPGLVLKILVHEGQKVEKGSGLIILEAMKMENEIKAHTAGITKEIRVREKTPVEKGDILLILE